MAENEGAAPAAPDPLCGVEAPVGGFSCVNEPGHGGAHHAIGQAEDGETVYSISWWSADVDVEDAPEGL